MAATDKASPIQVTIADSTARSGLAVVTLSGELDMANVELVRGRLEPLLSAELELLVFDLAALSFMDSSGIALFVQVANRVDAISLRNVSSLIQRVLDATGVAELLQVER